MSWLSKEQTSRLMFQARVAADGQVVPKTWRTRLQQRLFERGWSVPWIYTPAECARFWNIPAGTTDRMNRPEDYASGPIDIMRYVLEYVAPRVDRNEPVLEVGCNAGSKLNQMRLAGFQQLAGLEINTACFDVLRAVFPELHAAASLHAGAAHDVLPRFDTNHFGLVFSVSSLSLLHPRHHTVFDHIARICSGYIVTVELEWAGGPYYFPRNYRRLFEQHGFAQVASMLVTRDACPEPTLVDYDGHVLRVLRRRAR